MRIDRIRHGCINKPTVGRCSPWSRRGGADVPRVFDSMVSNTLKGWLRTTGFHLAPCT